MAVGQVFTWEVLSSGKVPQEESFRVVMEKLRATLGAESSVVSALLFGSVVRGDSNIRSDIDCGVIYETEQEPAAVAAMHSVDRLACSLHVPINFVPCDTVLASTRLHHLGTSFTQHLQTSIAAGGLIKGDFLGFLAPTLPTQLEVETYIEAKMYKLQESYAQMASFSDERLAVFLKKVLEAPMHVARKMLVHGDLLRGDSKVKVHERYLQVMPQHLGEQLFSLVLTDAWYSEELATQRLFLNEARYEKAIDHLKRNVPHVLRFLRSNILLLN